MKFALNLFAFFVSICVFLSDVHAQDALSLKSGDKILFKNTTYKLTGNEIIPDKSDSYTVIFTKIEEDEYSLNFWSGKKVENYKNNVLVSMTLSGTLKEIPSNQIFQWVPTDFSVGTKASVAYVSGGCLNSDVKVSFPRVTLKEGSRDIFFGGTSKALKVYEIFYQGTWTTDRCGVGKTERLIVFAPAINLILEDKSFSFDRTGFFNNGSSRLVTSIN